MKRLPPSLPSLRLSWTLNLNYKVGPSFCLDPFFPFIPCFSHNSSTLKLFVCLCMFFFFWLCFTVACCCHFVDSVTFLCLDALLLLLYLATSPTLLLHLIVTLPYYCYKLHLASPASSIFLLLWAPPCYCCKFHFVDAMSSTLPLLFHLATDFYHCCGYAWLFALSHYCSTLLLFHLCSFSTCTNGFTWNYHCCPTYLIVVQPCCCSTLLLPIASCVSLVGTSTLPFFPCRFWFLELEEQAMTN